MICNITFLRRCWSKEFSSSFIFQYFKNQLVAIIISYSPIFAATSLPLVVADLLIYFRVSHIQVFSQTPKG